MTKTLFWASIVIAFGLAFFVVLGFRCRPRLRHDTGTIMNRRVQNSAATTTYFTQDLYTVPPALQRNLNAVVGIDFNHDGFIDLIAIQNDISSVAYTSAPLLAYTNDGTGHFTESTPQVLGDVKTTNAQASIVADFNGDGLDDLFIVDLGQERDPDYGKGKGYFLFIQKPSGTLVNEASVRLPEFPWLPYSAASGDINGDGSIDLMVVSTGGPVYQLLVNNGQGYFSDETVRLPTAKPNWWPNNCLILDVNNDGYPDIFMGESAGHYPQDFIFMNDGTAHFTFAPDSTLPPHLLGTGSGTTFARAADLNGDGWMDLVLSCFNGPEMPIQILFNKGDGTYRDVSNLIIGPYLSMTNCGEFDRRIADVNGDGWPDLLGARNVWVGSFVPQLFINHAGSQFEDITSTVWSNHALNWGEPPRGEFVGYRQRRRYGCHRCLSPRSDLCARQPNPLYTATLYPPGNAGDFDGDGTEEVAVDFGSTGAWMFDNGVWSQLSAANPGAMLAADVDGDGIDELIANPGSLGLWVWDSGAWNQLTGMNVVSLAAGDVDADGAKEIIGDFGNAGPWLYDGGSWTQLSGVHADLLTTADLDGIAGDEVIADFGATGLWLWNPGARAHAQRGESRPHGFGQDGRRSISGRRFWANGAVDVDGRGWLDADQRRRCGLHDNRRHRRRWK